MAYEKNYTCFKGAPFGGDTIEWYIDYVGGDLTADTFLWKFALAEGSAATFSLSAAAAGSQGISLSYDATTIHPTSRAEVGSTRILPQIDEATLEGLTYSGADPLVLFHTLYHTPSGGSQRVWCYGTLTIRQGVQD